MLTIKRTLFLILFFAILFSPRVYSQKVMSAEEPVSIKNMEDIIPINPHCLTGTLSNGMKYYILENKKPEKRMLLRLVVSAGAVLEDDDQNGLAHLCEHMAFKGTKHFPKRDLINFLESIGMRYGADLNAYTDKDETVYMIEVPTDSTEKMEKAIQILEDWAHNVVYEDEEIEKERSVVREEWRLGRGAEDRISRKEYPILYHDSKYALRNIIGDTAIIMRASHETLRRFYKDWYRPELMAIVAVGDFDKHYIESIIKSHFSNIPNKEHPRVKEKFPVPDNEGALVSIEKDKELAWPTAELIFKYNKPKSGTYNNYRNSVVENIYGEMLRERLRELQHKADPPFNFAFVYNGSFAGDKNAFYMIAYTKQDGFDKAYQTLLTEAFRVMQHGFTVTEFERAKKELMKNIEQSYNERDKTESESLIWDIQANFIDSTSAPGIEYTYRLYKYFLPTIELNEVNALTPKLIHTNNSVILASLPDKEGVPIPNKDDILAKFNEISKSDIPPYIDKVSDKPLFDKEVIPGTITDIKEYKELGVTEWTLSNGLKVYLKPTDFKNDEILFEGYSFGGSSTVPDDDYESAVNASWVINQSGVGSYNQDELTKALSGKIASVYTNIQELSSDISGECSPKDLETMFQLINLRLTEPRKDEESFKSVIEKMRAYIKNAQNDPESNYRDSIGVTVYNYHKRAMPLTEADLEKVSLDRVMKIYNNMFDNPSDLKLFFVGNLVVDKFKPMVEKYLASIPQKNSHNMWKDVGKRVQKGKINKDVNKGIEAKGEVALLFNGNFVWTPRNEFVINMLSKILDYRLQETIREEKNGTYGAYSYPAIEHYPNQSYLFYIFFGCDPKRVDELVSTVYDILDTLQKLPPKEFDMTKAKASEKKEREVNLKENKWWMDKLYECSYNRVDFKQILDEEKYIDDLKPEEIQNAAKKYFNKDNVIKIVLYPEKKE